MNRSESDRFELVVRFGPAAFLIVHDMLWDGDRTKVLTLCWLVGGSEAYPTPIIVL